MTKMFDQKLEELHSVLCKLEPTGTNGFEGLLAVILAKIVGSPFRLAGSGSQHGKDGQANSLSGSVAFEGKLYTGAINKNEVLAKITEITASSNPPDLWIIGATDGKQEDRPKELYSNISMGFITHAVATHHWVGKVPWTLKERPLK